MQIFPPLNKTQTAIYYNWTSMRGILKMNCNKARRRRRGANSLMYTMFTNLRGPNFYVNITLINHLKMKML